MSGLRIVVTGLAATYPLGGVFWDYLQYPLGFRRLGHHALYLEDTGGWCYSADRRRMIADGSANAAALERAVARLDPGLAWHYRDARGHAYGSTWDEVVRFCDGADLFLNVSGASTLRPEYRRASRLALIDSDPMYTQASVPPYLAGTLDGAARERLERMLSHDVFFTFGENVGALDCRIPTGLFSWIPTRQPVVVDALAPARTPVHARRRTTTTVASWEPHEEGPVVEGIRYHGKSVEIERFKDLPAHTRVPLEVALGGDAPRRDLRSRGWRIVDPHAVAADPWAYRSYLASSLAEWSVAKHAYVTSRSGWFSGRSALYLALGVPVVVQDTGFGRNIPTGSGLLPFGSIPEAAAAIDEVASEPTRHAEAALDIAATSFSSDLVLSQLLEGALRA